MMFDELKDRHCDVLFIIDAIFDEWSGDEAAQAIAVLLERLRQCCGSLRYATRTVNDGRAVRTALASGFNTVWDVDEWRAIDQCIRQLQPSASSACSFAGVVSSIGEAFLLLDNETANDTHNWTASTNPFQYTLLQPTVCFFIITISCFYLNIEMARIFINFSNNNKKKNNRFVYLYIFLIIY
jgi:hypothetical protein